MYKISAFLFFLFVLAGCKTTSYSEKYGEIKNVSAVTLQRHASGTEVYAPQPVSDEKIIKLLLENINTAKVDGPWKGAGWDELTIVTKDSAIVLKTNGEVFGTRNSGTFYRFPEKNILKIIAGPVPGK